MPLKLRLAAPSDSTDLTDILHRAKASWGYPEDKMVEFREHWRISEELIQSQHMTVAEADGVPVAFSGLVVQGEDTLLIDYLFVAPEVQKQGVGDLLLTRAEDYARQNNLKRLCLESDTNAVPFYQKRGFKTIAIRESEMLPGNEIPLMERFLPPAVHKVSSLDVALSNEPWEFERANSKEISAHFEEAKKRIGLLWNGRTLKLVGYKFKDGKFEGKCVETSYAAFLAWRNWGAPDASAHNLFGSAVLRSSDGALLYGVMSDLTATGGLIFPPGGNLDPEDVTAEGKVNVVGAIYRELEEETGLTRDDVLPGDLLVAFDGPRISISQVFDVDQLASSLREKIMRFSDSTEDRELADMRIIRTHKDLNDPAIIPFARAIGELLLP
jgi:N-acetylglutamate synthase-like GNAT family acetyltransferase/8-oxo-dGTP pyrophosphatase MutT (NUDIX family)